MHGKIQLTISIKGYILRKNIHAWKFKGGANMLKNLQVEMLKEDVNQKMIADFLKVDVRTVRNKISGKTDFGYPEAVQIRNKFFPNVKLEYLFADEEDKPKKTA